MSSPDNFLHVLHIIPEAKQSITIESLLELQEIPFSRWQDADSGELRLDIFMPSEAEAHRLQQTLQSQLSELIPEHSWQLTSETIQNKNWQDAWKDFFHVERVSDRIVIRPSHEEYTPSPGDCVIDIDPGMSFGTGQHATTRGCLHFLDCLSGNGQATTDFLDLGCGSGILSIAAAKLGFSPISALDIDPDSVRIASENAVSNGVASKIEFAPGNVAELNLPRKYSTVAANILATVLLEHAEKIAATVRHPGHLLLAGILTEQYPSVRDRYSALGFSEIENITNAEWTSGCFKTT
jgi:ribosomal protein L11 methyltransferase